MRHLELTDDEAAVLWFIGRQLDKDTDVIATRPNGRATIVSLSAKLAALVVDDAATGDEAMT